MAGELDVLRMFFYSPDTKSSAQQYEETAAILAAAFATCDRPYATTDPGHYYGPYTVYIDPGDLVVPCDGLFE
jgi:hypothetical protein